MDPVGGVDIGRAGAPTAQGNGEIGDPQAVPEAVLGFEQGQLGARMRSLAAGEHAHRGGPAGKLVALGALTVEASFPGTPPAEVDKVAGVGAVQVAGHHLTCQVRGPIDDLLTVLAAGHPETLLSREPSLEELFLSIYGEQERINNGTRRG
jgi:hypothetical protein